MSDIFFQERVSVDVLHIYAHFYIFGECHAAAYCARKVIYYMEKGTLATKQIFRFFPASFPFVTLASCISINYRLFYSCCFQNGRRFQGLWG